MKLRMWLVAVLGIFALGIAVPAYAERRSEAPDRRSEAPDRRSEAPDRRSEAKEQVDFGIAVAQKGLWKEATYRWQKATEIDPSYAAAWNNLGIGFEQLGRFDEARKAYDKALALDPSNNFIRNNYDLFREIYDRQNRRRDK